MLKGKAKEDFEKWYIPWVRNQRPDYVKFTDEQILRKFYRKVFSEQYGVLVDWFDSVGINISIEPYWCVCKITAEIDQEVTFDMMVFSDSQCDYDYSNHATRLQARTKAIEQAIEIYNNK